MVLLKKTTARKHTNPAQGSANRARSSRKPSLALRPSALMAVGNPPAKADDHLAPFGTPFLVGYGVPGVEA